MGNFEYDQVKMAILAMREHDEIQGKLWLCLDEREVMEDAKENDGVRGPADTCFCKGCGYCDCDGCEHSVEVK